MKIKLITNLFLIAIISIGCNNPNFQNQQSNEIGIVIKNDQKWKINEEMTPYIVDNEKLYNEYDNGDYKKLAMQLKHNNNSLINSCTMSGESHDELHKWLLPHLELVDALSKAETTDKADQIIAKLGESFKIYNTYFQ
jgi:hypothetical protein